MITSTNKAVDTGQRVFFKKLDTFNNFKIEENCNNIKSNAQNGLMFGAVGILKII